ncbi:MAG: D-alanyl-D-alanine carboxypeptidase [Clostridia bacterium]|nr:D-alanyl-D-alanine carboxypeptidase [Clostridia bacterium]
MFKKLLVFPLIAAMLAALTAGQVAASQTAVGEAVATKMATLKSMAQKSTTQKSTDKSGSGTAQQAAQPAAFKAKAAVLMEQSTGKVLYELNPHEKLACASITKIMTELLVLQAIENGTLKLSQKITVSEHAASMGGSDIWLKPNEVMTVNDLFKAMAIQSANDAAVALAEAVSGTEQAFVNEMNTEAGELGMKDTHFVNCTGLDADGHLTSAYDIALMSRELLTHKEIFSYCTVWMDTLRGGKTGLTNTNRLVRFYTGCNGLKTGTTSKAGVCISATAQRSGMQLIAVTLGSATSDERFTAARNLLDFGFTNWAVTKPQPLSQKLTVRVLRGESDTVQVVTEGTPTILIDKALQKKVEQKVSLVPNVMAPVEKGQVLGQITLSVNGKKIGGIPLIAKSAVARMSFSKAFAKLFHAMVAA